MEGEMALAQEALEIQAGHWCHECQTYANIEENHSCSMCGSEFVEFVLSESEYSEVNNLHPEDFVPELPNEVENNESAQIVMDGITQLVEQVVGELRTRESINVNSRSQISVHVHNSSVLGNDGRTIEQITHDLLMNGASVRGKPPAAKSVLKRLKENKKKIEEEEIDCAVCKDKFAIGTEVIELDCSHPFCEECIIPWLEKNNTCPVCREELKTDDADYELDKLPQSNTSTTTTTQQTNQNNNSYVSSLDDSNFDDEYFE